MTVQSDAGLGSQLGKQLSTVAANAAEILEPGTPGMWLPGLIG
jgi:hypothetical protein